MPEALVHRVIVRESRYQPGLVGRGGTIGLMQIKLATARGLGYTGDAAGLRDPDTNLTYGVKYLAGAYRAANGDHDRAVHYFAGGYYYAAKRQRLERPMPARADAGEVHRSQTWRSRQSCPRANASRRKLRRPRHASRTLATAEARFRGRQRIGAVQFPQAALTRPAHRPTLALFRGELR